MFLAMTAADNRTDWSPDLQAFITLQSNWSRSSYNCCRSNVPAVDLLRKHLEQMKVNIASGLHAAWGSGRSFSSLNTGISTGSAPAKPLGMLVLELATLLAGNSLVATMIAAPTWDILIDPSSSSSISFVVGSSKTASSGRFSKPLQTNWKTKSFQLQRTRWQAKRRCCCCHLPKLSHILANEVGSGSRRQQGLCGWPFEQKLVLDYRLLPNIHLICCTNQANPSKISFSRQLNVSFQCQRDSNGRWCCITSAFHSQPYPATTRCGNSSASNVQLPFDSKFLWHHCCQWLSV